jgi:MFS family permease
MTAARDTRFEYVLDSAAMTRFQIGVVLLCALVAMLDGFDTQSIAFAAPDIATEWALPASAFGLVFSIGVFGGLIGAVAAGSISDRIGRRPVLLCAGLLPESAQFLALRGDNIALNRITARLDFSGAGPLGSSDAVATDDHGIPPAAARTLVARLFGEGRAPGTLLLWTALFLSLLATYLLVNWIPIIARESGTTADTATFGLVALNLGAVVGAFAIGRLADRFHRTYVVGAAFLVGALAISAMGWSDSTGTLLPVAVFATGIFAVGAQMATVGITAGFYETSLRATGVGWSMAVGRIGAIVGPALGGLLVALTLTGPVMFGLVALTAIGAGTAVIVLTRFLPRADTHGDRDTTIPAAGIDGTANEHNGRNR